MVKWHWVYFALGVVGLLSTGLHEFGIPPVSLIPLPAIALVFHSSVITASILHWYADAH